MLLLSLKANPVLYFQISHDCTLLNPYAVIIHEHIFIRRWITYVDETTSLNEPRINQ